jgi:hypothetical protein
MVRLRIRKIVKDPDSDMATKYLKIPTSARNKPDTGQAVLYRFTRKKVTARERGPFDRTPKIPVVLLSISRLLIVKMPAKNHNKNR